MPNTECSTTACPANTGISLVNYTYDSFGRKVKPGTSGAKVDNTGKISYYIYDGMDSVFEKTWYGGTPSSSWIVRGLGVAPGVGNIICVQNKKREWRPSGSITVATTDYYHPNHRGDTVFTTDESGEKKAELKYDAFGKTVYESNASDVKYRFSSKEWDANAQLYYYGFRWYDPEHGIWTTKDPLSIFAGDLNVYRMVFNNPICFVDIYGLLREYSTDNSWMNDPEFSNDWSDVYNFIENKRKCDISDLNKLFKLFLDIFTIVLGKFDSSGSGTIEIPMPPKPGDSDDDTDDDAGDDAF